MRDFFESRPDPIFHLLTGDDQIGEFAQILLRNELETKEARRKARAKLPKKPFTFPGTFSMPLIESAFASAPCLASIMSVQPMTPPPGSPVIPIEVVDAEYLREYAEKELAYYSRTLKEGELLKRFKYGGVLSERGGFFVIHQDTPERVLRYVVTFLS